METIHFKPSPAIKSYNSMEQSIAGSIAHPLQEKAQRSGELLEQARIVQFRWCRDTCFVMFTNGRVLRVGAHDFQLDWEVCDQVPTHAPENTEPVRIAWHNGPQTVFDPSAEFGGIVGGRFAKLFINEVGLLLYTYGNPILWFRAHCLREPGENFLFAWLDD